MERGEVFYREDIRTSFGYAIVGLTVGVIAIGVLVTVAGAGYTFVQQLRK